MRGPRRGLEPRDKPRWPLVCGPTCGTARPGWPRTGPCPPGKLPANKIPHSLQTWPRNNGESYLNIYGKIDNLPVGQGCLRTGTKIQGYWGTC